MSNTEIREEKNEVVVAYLQSMLSRVSHVKGGEYIILLLKNPVTQFPYFYLEYNKKSEQLNNNGDYEYVHDMHNLEKVTDYLFKTPIPMCDEQAKNEVQRRLIEITKKINKTEKLGELFNVYDLELERKALVQYLAEVLMPNGKIKSFTDSLERSKRAVLQNVRRFLREVSLIDKSVYDIIKKKIEVSKYTISTK